MRPLVSPLLALIALCWSLLGATPAMAADIPQDEAGFMQYVGAAFAKELPDLKFESAGPLTLIGRRADGVTTGTLSLATAYDYCLRVPNNCERAVGRYVGGMVQVAREAMKPAEKSAVRLVIRRRAFIDQVRVEQGSDPVPVYTRPLTPNLVIVPVIDLPLIQRYVNARDLPALGVDETGLFRLGEENLRTTQKPFVEILKQPPINSIGVLTDDDFASSRIIFHDDWNDLAARLNGTLVVMLPTQGLLLYAGADNDTALGAMYTVGTDAARKTARGLSNLILRWTPKGWEEVKP